MLIQWELGPDERTDVTKIVMNIWFGAEKISKNEKLQKTFQDLLYSNYKIVDYQKEAIGNEPWATVREASAKPYHKFHGQIRCRFSTKFLRENRDWLQ